MMEEITKKWLARHYPGVFEDVMFGNHYGRTGAKMGKPEMCSAIGALCLIDDSLKYGCLIRLRLTRGWLSVSRQL